MNPLARLKAMIFPSRPETRDEKVLRIRGLVGKVVPAFGDIMADQPLVIFPSSKLPLPKDEMKIALQLAWGMTNNQQIKDHVAAAYLHLSHFRDDIDKPIDPELKDDLSPDRTIELLAPFLAISRSMTEEAMELGVEFNRFTRSYEN